MNSTHIPSPCCTSKLILSDSILAEGVIRGDGQVDFIGALGCRRGTNRLRVRMKNSWGIERWDSLRVHVTSVPAYFEPLADTISLPGRRSHYKGHEGPRPGRLGCPSGQPPVRHRGHRAGRSGRCRRGRLIDRPAASARPRRVADPPDPRRLRRNRGRTDPPGRRRIRRSWSASTSRRRGELMITSMGQFGLGAAADDFGAVTVRGRLGAETAVTVAYDSRTLDAGRDAYGRTISPLDDAQYPILGDASVRRSEASSPARPLGPHPAWNGLGRRRRAGEHGVLVPPSRWPSTAGLSTAWRRTSARAR